jgi:hypothetical protein
MPPAPLPAFGWWVDGIIAGSSVRWVVESSWSSSSPFAATGGLLALLGSRSSWPTDQQQHDSNTPPK